MAQCTIEFAQALETNCGMEVHKVRNVDLTVFQFLRKHADIVRRNSAVDCVRGVSYNREFVVLEGDLLDLGIKSVTVLHDPSCEHNVFSGCAVEVQRFEWIVRKEFLIRDEVFKRVDD